MTNVYIRPSLPGDSWLFAETRDAEVTELASLGATYEQCIRFGMLHSRAQTVFFDEEPAAIFGVIDYGDHSVVWAAFTKAIERHPIAFLRTSKRLAAELPPVVNYVDARNLKAVKWFKWLGFEVSDPIPYGNNGEPFHMFTNMRFAEAA